MALLVCSLYLHQSGHVQEIPPRQYTLVRFPFEGEVESSDEHGMHQAVQPDGRTVGYDDDRSGLIWPAADGWAVLDANIHWEGGSYTEIRDRFVRDPLNLSTGYDSTATDHRAPSPGMQCVTKAHLMYVRQGTPLGLMVHHNDSTPRRLVHAQFKVAIHT